MQIMSKTHAVNKRGKIKQGYRSYIVCSLITLAQRCIVTK